VVWQEKPAIHTSWVKSINMASGASGQNILGSLSSLASSGPSGATADLVNKLLPMVFGGRADQVSSMLSKQAGVSASSMGGLLKMAVPLIIGFLGKLYGNGSLNLSSLAGMLRSEAPNLPKYVPANLLSGGHTNCESHCFRSGRFGGFKKRARPGSFCFGVLGAILLAWLVYWALNAGKVDTQPAMSAAKNAVNNVATTAGNVANSAWAALGEFFKVKLPDGTEPDVPDRLPPAPRLLGRHRDVV
jgi:OmpA-OmpF porin, OOP family